MGNDNKRTTRHDDTITISETRPKAGQVGGKLQMTKEVVATIAKLAARPIKGIHIVGRAGLLRRAMGRHRTRGVNADVGEKQAALDMELVVEYGADIHDISSRLRKAIAADVKRMAGRDVVEVNIRITGIELPPEDEEQKPAPRVQ